MSVEFGGSIPLSFSNEGQWYNYYTFAIITITKYSDRDLKKVSIEVIIGLNNCSSAMKGGFF